MKMKMKAKKSLRVTTSIYIPIEDLKWIKENRKVVSTFVCDAIREKIERETGFSSQIRRLESMIKETEELLERRYQELEELKKREEEWKKKKEREELNDLLTRAAKNVLYESWEEMAKDLEESRGSIPIEEWKSMVREKWDEYHVEQ